MILQVIPGDPTQYLPKMCCHQTWRFCSKSLESSLPFSSMKKGPTRGVLFRGWSPTHFCGYFFFINHGNKNPVHYFMESIRPGALELRASDDRFPPFCFTGNGRCTLRPGRLLTVAPTAASPHRDPDGGRSSGALSHRDLAAWQRLTFYLKDHPS